MVVLAGGGGRPQAELWRGSIREFPLVKYMYNTVDD